MSSPPLRPDPDALLRRVKADAARADRTRLTIFFGFAPGVGKTYRMLEVAHALRDEGIDVVVGAVETHGRKDTHALTEGIETLPRRKIDYRGRELEELDLDAALARKPAVILIDELAHTNAPGSRHKKRWQDVLELLDAGIPVLTTLNVQHVESLNDVVAQITHVQVRETVPDSVLDRADEIELVDLSPEQLLQRLREGKVYLGEQAARAAQHFFQRGNLLALRELALRRTAERVDADMLAYRAEHEVDRTWATAERILVCVSAAPASAQLVRAGRRMAAGLRAPWIAAYVDAPARAPILGRDRDRLESHLKLAEELGATIARLSDPHASAGILAYARRHNVTRIVIGKPTHPRLRDVVLGSFLDQIVRGSGDIEVHVISGSGAPPPSEDATPGRPARRSGAASDLLYAVGAAAGSTALAWFARDVLGAPDVEMLYLVGVMLVATSLGRNAAIFTSALSVAAFDFFFVPPHFTFAVHDARYVLTFGMMFGIGIVLSTLTERVKRQERAALDREARTANLLSLSRDLGTAQDESAVATAAVLHAAEVFSGAATLFVRRDGDDIEAVAHAGEPSPDGGDDVPGVVRWSVENGKPAGLGTDTLPGSRLIAVPIRAPDATQGVLAVAPADGVALSSDERAFLDAFSRQVALALERVRLAEEARRHALRARTEELRSTLLSAVSHDLRTPLAVITGAATMLRDRTSMPTADSEVTGKELLETICEEAERLERLVANLLDMTRLESGVVLRREWVPIVEVLETALARLARHIRDREVVTRLPEELAMVEVDPVLAERLFVNLIENAAKHAPPPSPIEIVATIEGDRVVVDVLDRGPGIEPGAEQRIFERFQRGRGAGGTGVGLGLAICAAIASAHGAEVTAANREGGGARFRVRFAASGGPPAEPPSAPSRAFDGGDE